VSVELVAMLSVQALDLREQLVNERDPRVRDCIERSLAILAATGTLAHQATLTAERLAEAEARDLARLERFGHLEDTVKRLEARLNRPQRRPWWRFWR
jgi:hypothetical protein